MEDGGIISAFLRLSLTFPFLNFSLQSPRPIALVVAKELSEVPAAVLEQRRLAEEEEIASVVAAQAKMEEMTLQRPSPANGEEAVADSVAAQSVRS